MGVRIFSPSLPNNRNNNVRRPSEAKRQQDQSIVAVFLSFFLSFFVFSSSSRIFFSFYILSYSQFSFLPLCFVIALLVNEKKDCLVSNIDDNDDDDDDVLTSSFVTFSLNGKTTTIVLLTATLSSLSKTHRAYFLYFEHLYY
jgi:hypothetical protein